MRVWVRVWVRVGVRVGVGVGMGVRVRAAVRVRVRARARARAGVGAGVGRSRRTRAAMPEAMSYAHYGRTMAVLTMAVLYSLWLYGSYTYYGAREQHARGDELRLRGAAAVEGESGEGVCRDHAVQHEDLLLLHCRDQRAVALVSRKWWVVSSRY